MDFHASLRNIFCQLFTRHYGGLWETSSRELIRKSGDEKMSSEGFVQEARRQQSIERKREQ